MCARAFSARPHDREIEAEGQRKIRTGDETEAERGKGKRGACEKEGRGEEINVSSECH